jgi:hypothetical protein
MNKKIYVLNDCKATFICPRCGNVREENVLPYMGLNKAIRVRYRCKCGCSESVLLERRKVFRKEVDLTGVYTRYVSEKAMDEGIMKVTDISRNGLRIKLNGEVSQPFNIGDKLLLKFHLDDKSTTLLKKQVIVKVINSHHIGTEFCSDGPYDKILGFYLLNAAQEDYLPLLGGS